MRNCQGCGTPLPEHDPRRGRPRKWCSERCRRSTLYSGTCIFCGGRTNGNDGPGRAPDVCTTCIRTKLVWTRERVTAAIGRWADDHGGLPPKSYEWHRTGGDSYPSAETVRRIFGSFNEAVRAAGLEPWQERDPQRFRPEVMESVYARLAAGETATAVAADIGVSAPNLREALRTRGVSIATLRRKEAA